MKGKKLTQPVIISKSKYDLETLKHAVLKISFS